MLIALLASPRFVEAQWAYLTPPWNFDTHPKYAGKSIPAIPRNEWEQMAAFDSSAKCEKARLFAREIRNLAPNDRERLLALFAASREEQARADAEPRIAYDIALKKAFADTKVIQESEASTLRWWSASKCVPLR